MIIEREYYVINLYRTNKKPFSFYYLIIKNLSFKKYLNTLNVFILYYIWSSTNLLLS